MQRKCLIPTDMTILQTIIDNTLERNQNVISFIELLLASNNRMNISLNGAWGSGKTFFVKNTIETIKAFAKKENVKPSDGNIITETYLEQGSPYTDIRNAHKVNIDYNTNSILPIYYNAWENDNDEDPVLSILFTILQSRGLSASVEHDWKEIMLSVLDGLTGKPISNFIEKLEGNNLVGKICEYKETESRINHFWENLQQEFNGKVVIFIDELDRCKPTFAVQLLERIKHYFDHENIIFVFSTNKVQLQHTIKQYYGQGFDALGYFDKFFDINIELPKANHELYYKSLNKNTNFAHAVTLKLIDFFDFELREISTLYTQVQTATAKYYGRNYQEFFDEEFTEFYLNSLFVPIILAIKLRDMNEYKLFISGKNEKLMKELSAHLSSIPFFVQQILFSNESLEKVMSPKEATDIDLTARLNELYKNIFTPKKECYRIGKLEITKSSKAKILEQASLLAPSSHFFPENL